MQVKYCKWKSCQTVISGSDYDSACILTGLDLSVCGLISKDRAPGGEKTFPLCCEVRYYLKSVGKLPTKLLLWRMQLVLKVTVMEPHCWLPFLCHKMIDFGEDYVRYKRKGWAA